MSFIRFPSAKTSSHGLSITSSETFCDFRLDCDAFPRTRKSEIGESVDQFCVQISVCRLKHVFRSGSVIRSESSKWWVPEGIIKSGEGLNAS